jgi:site-specific recombinase XerC
MGLPKGRMERAVLELLGDAGVRVTPTARGYRPHVHLDAAEVKVLKPQNSSRCLPVAATSDRGAIGPPTRRRGGGADTDSIRSISSPRTQRCS